jgi:hypothetical protein
MNLVSPPERLFTPDGQALRANDPEASAGGGPDAYKVLGDFSYRCPVSGRRVALSSDGLVNHVWNRRPSCFPPGLLTLLAPLGSGYDFVSPGGLYVRLLFRIDEMGKMSGRWFADVLLVLEIDPRDNSGLIAAAPATQSP